MGDQTNMSSTKPPANPYGWPQSQYLVPFSDQSECRVERITTNEGFDLLAYLPDIKPPHIDDDFIDAFSKDSAVIIESPTMYPLSVGSFAAGIALGANDFSNAMGTTVGSGAMSLGGARLVGGAACWYGASFGSKETAGTIKKGIWDLSETSLNTEDSQIALSFALLGASAWVMYATSRGWPVSTSQSTVGGLLGVGLTAEAINTGDVGDLAKGVQFGKVGNIAQSWVNSPLAGGAASVGIYTIARPLYKYTQFIPRVNYLWRGAIVVTGGMVAYGLGRNDTGNFIGPLAGGLDAARQGEGGGIGKTADVNQWMRVMGGMVILIGMHNFSRGVTSTVGSGIMELNMAKAVSAQLGTAIVVDYYSDQKKPISTSHTIMGSVFGLALASAAEKMPWRFVGQIGRAWLLSIPVSGMVAGGAYTGYMSVASIDRDAPPVDDGEVNEFEQSGVSLLRTNRLVKDAALSGFFHVGASGPTHLARAGRVLGRTPVAPLGLFLVGMAAVEASENGVNRSFAQGTKMVAETIPVVGGAVQAVDGFYGLANDKSWWTGLSMSPEAAWGQIGAGSGWLAIDLIAARLVGQAAMQAHSNRLLNEGLQTAQAAPIENVKPGVMGRIRGAMQRSAASQDALEAERAEIKEFRERIMRETFDTVARDTGTNWLSRRLIQPGVEAMIDKADSMALKRLAVDQMHLKLVEHIARFTDYKPNATLEEKTLAAEAQNRALYALGQIYPEAYEKGRPVFLERRAKKALLEAGLEKTTVNALIKATEKELPKGAALLTADNKNERASWERMIKSAADRAVVRYNSWQRYPRMVGRVAAEPLTLGTTFRFLGDGFRSIRPRLKPVTGGIMRLVRGWWNTVNPFRFAKVIKSDRAADEKLRQEESREVVKTIKSRADVELFTEILKAEEGNGGLSKTEISMRAVELSRTWNTLSKHERDIQLGKKPATVDGVISEELKRWTRNTLAKHGRRGIGYTGPEKDRVERDKDRTDLKTTNPMERNRTTERDHTPDPKNLKKSGK
jgi:inorganic phosphate transporter, PiT family